MNSKALLLIVGFALGVFASQLFNTGDDPETGSAVNKPSFDDNKLKKTLEEIENLQFENDTLAADNSVQEGLLLAMSEQLGAMQQQQGMTEEERAEQQEQRREQVLKGSTGRMPDSMQIAL